MHERLVPMDQAAGVCATTAWSQRIGAAVRRVLADGGTRDRTPLTPGGREVAFGRLLAAPPTA